MTTANSLHHTAAEVEAARAVLLALEHHRQQATLETRSITARLERAHVLALESLVALTQRRRALEEVLTMLQPRIDEATERLHLAQQRLQALEQQASTVPSCNGKQSPPSACSSAVRVPAQG